MSCSQGLPRRGADCHETKAGVMKVRLGKGEDLRSPSSQPSPANYSKVSESVRTCFPALGRLHSPADSTCMQGAVPHDNH